MSAWEPQLSDWIDGSVKPTIVGVYQREFAHAVGLVPSHRTQHFSRWDGEQWFQYSDTPHAAMGRRHASEYQSIPWRGLRYDPALSRDHAS